MFVIKSKKKFQMYSRLIFKPTPDITTKKNLKVTLNITKKLN